MTGHPSRVADALSQGHLEQIAVAQSAVLQRAELGRRQWERALSLVRTEPGDYDFQVEKTYDSLIDLCEALLAAHGLRRRARAGHRLLLQLAEELLGAQWPVEAQQLAMIGDHLRQERNQLKYDRLGVASQQERDEVLRALPPILEALEAAAFAAIGQPRPAHLWRP